MEKSKPSITLGTGSINTMDSKQVPPAVTSNSNAAKDKENVTNSGKSKVTFKTGSQLPSLSDDLPSVNDKAKQKPKPNVNFNDQFDEAFEDDFSAGDGDDIDTPEESGDFNANNLMDLGGYQKKR